jgi:hypothetical protein
MATKRNLLLPTTAPASFNSASLAYLPDVPNTLLANAGDSKPAILVCTDCQAAGCRIFAAGFPDSAMGSNVAVNRPAGYATERHRHRSRGL